MTVFNKHGQPEARPVVTTINPKPATPAIAGEASILTPATGERLKVNSGTDDAVVGIYHADGSFTLHTVEDAKRIALTDENIRVFKEVRVTRTVIFE